MSRFLHRPMFRTGGSAGQGITSGLTRPGYNRGRVVNPGGYGGEEFNIFESEDERKKRLEKLYPGLYGESEYEFYIKEDGTWGQRKKKKFTEEDLQLEKSILDFAPEKIEREVIDKYSALPGGREEEVGEEVIGKYSALPGGREEEVGEEVIGKYSALPGGREVEKVEKEKPSSAAELFGAAPELPKSTAGADFWLNLGTNILAQPGGKPILQTLGTAGKESLARYQQQRGQENLLKYKHGQSERQFQLEWYKALNDEDKLKAERMMKWYMSKGMTEEEALNTVMYRKSQNPKDVERQAKLQEQEIIRNEVSQLITDLRREDENIQLTYRQGKNILDAKNKIDEKGWKAVKDSRIIIDEEGWKNEDGRNIWPGENEEGVILFSSAKHADKYIDGFVYVDITTGKTYKKQDNKLINTDLLPKK
jgi:hypothetical protein